MIQFLAYCEHARDQGDTVAKKFLVPLLATALALSAACSTDSPPTPRPSTSQCPPVDTELTKQDLVLTDAKTCSRLHISDVARFAQSVLGREYEIKIIPYSPNRNYSCVVDGKPINVRGDNTPLVRFCDGNKVFVVTAPGIETAAPDDSFAAVWIVIATASTPARFSTVYQQLCAAGYIMNKRPNATANDKELFTYIQHLNWKEAAAPWQYARWGYEAAAAGKDLAACDRPQAVAGSPGPKTS
jgi:hypothetical protein